MGCHVLSTFDGMDFFNCYAGFLVAYQEILATGKPVLIEAMSERFRGHSISDPALYRTKEHLKERMERDPIVILRNELFDRELLTEDEYKAIDKKNRDIVVDALEFAETSPWPEISTLEQDVFAP